MTTRQNVIDAFLVKLAQIRKANGYTCDIGQTVEYAEGVQEEPKLDCVAVVDGHEAFGRHIRRGHWERHLQLYVVAALVKLNPKVRANAAGEDILKWLENNYSMGIENLKIEVVAITSDIDNLGELAELVVELKVTY